MWQIFYRISRRFPELPLKLKQSGMKETPEQFVKKTMLSSFYMTTGLVLVFAAVLAKMTFLRNILLFLTPILFVVFFFYFIKLPDVRIMRSKKQINQEIIYAGRFLIVELKSGVLLYEALRNISQSYKTIGRYFKDIVTSVDMGTTLEDALVDATEYTPSEDLRRVLWQILNSLNTGADVADSLTAVVEQITKRQAIEISQYAKKLNPYAMFYMMIAVIIPSLGITMLVVLSSFFPISIDALTLIILAVGIGFIQLIFLTLIKSSRPAVGI